MNECLVIEKLPFPVHLLELYQQLSEQSHQPLDVLAFDLLQVLKAEPSGLDKALCEFVLNEYFCELDENNQVYSPARLTEGMQFLVSYIRQQLITKFSESCLSQIASLSMVSPTDVQLVLVFKSPKQKQPSVKGIYPWQLTSLI